MGIQKKRQGRALGRCNGAWRAGIWNRTADISCCPPRWMRRTGAHSTSRMLPLMQCLFAAVAVLAVAVEEGGECVAADVRQPDEGPEPARDGVPAHGGSQQDSQLPTHSSCYHASSICLLLIFVCAYRRFLTMDG